MAKWLLKVAVVVVGHPALATQRLKRAVVVGMLYLTLLDTFIPHAEPHGVFKMKTEPDTHLIKATRVVRDSSWTHSGSLCHTAFESLVLISI